MPKTDAIVKWSELVDRSRFIPMLFIGLRQYYSVGVLELQDMVETGGIRESDVNHVVGWMDEVIHLQ